MSSRLATIDALRGFAALWVFAYHLWNVYCPNCSPQTEPIPIGVDSPAAVVATFPLCGYGYAGIGLFFVLSGFCIHAPQARRFHARGSDQLQLREFARRRFWRLYPAYLASLFLASLGLGAMNWSWATPPGPGGITQNYIANAFGLAWILPNALLALPIQPEALTLNPVTWTLVYELQFYALYPLLLKLVRKVGFGSVAGVLLVMELAFTLIPTPDFLLPLEPHFRHFFLRRYLDWFAGMWLAEKLMSGQPLSVPWCRRLFVLGFGGGGLASAFTLTWPLHELLLVLGSVGLVGWAVATPGTLSNRITRLLAPVGEWSYSLYLVHMPLMRLVFALFILLAGGTLPDGLQAVAGVVCVIVVLLTARLWYRLFEKPYLPGNTPVKPAIHQPSFA